MKNDTKVNKYEKNLRDMLKKCIKDEKIHCIM